MNVALLPEIVVPDTTGEYTSTDAVIFLVFTVSLFIVVPETVGVFTETVKVDVFPFKVSLLIVVPDTIGEYISVVAVIFLAFIVSVLTMVPEIVGAFKVPDGVMITPVESNAVPPVPFQVAIALFTLPTGPVTVPAFTPLIVINPLADDTVTEPAPEMVLR